MAFEATAAEDAVLALETVTLPVVLCTAPDAEVLRRRAREVPLSQPLEEVAQRMLATLEAARGVGIAAPQVGLSWRVVWVVEGAEGETPEAVLAVNPMIVCRSSELRESYEGCLSVPDRGGLVRRYAWVDVRYSTLDRRRVEKRVSGFDAVVWQHEIDHLDGVLYTDRLIAAVSLDAPAHVDGAGSEALPAQGEEGPLP